MSGDLGIAAARPTQQSKSKDSTSGETNGLSKGRSAEYSPLAASSPVKAPINGPSDSQTSITNLTSEETTSAYVSARSWEFVTTMISSTRSFTASIMWLINGCLLYTSPSPRDR